MGVDVVFGTMEPFRKIEVVLFTPVEKTAILLYLKNNKRCYLFRSDECKASNKRIILKLNIQL